MIDGRRVVLIEFEIRRSSIYAEALLRNLLRINNT